MRKLIFGGTIVNEGREFKGSIVIDGDRINKIIEAGTKHPVVHTMKQSMPRVVLFCRGLSTSMSTSVSRA